jgi:monothiol glutaredoxin
MSSIEDTIRDQIANHPVLLYMKGVPDMPQCGFSAKAVACLQSTGVPFAYVNILAAPHIREKLPSVSQWPTFPQLFVGGELVGGSDIVDEIHRKGELKPMLETAVAAATPAAE